MTPVKTLVEAPAMAPAEAPAVEVLWWRAALEPTPAQQAMADAKLRARAAWLTRAGGRDGGATGGRADAAETLARLERERAAYARRRVHPAQWPKPRLVQAPHGPRGDPEGAAVRMAGTGEAGAGPGIEVGLWTAEAIRPGDCRPERVLASAGPGRVLCRRAPVNVVFYGRGSAWDVAWTMTQGWTTPRWRRTNGGPRAVYLRDARHGGADAWRSVHDHSLQPAGDRACFGTRDHLRLWGGDHAGRPQAGQGAFGEYAVGQAHFEDYRSWWLPCAHEVQSYDGARAAVQASFLDAAGRPRWYVGAMAFVQAGNAVPGKADGRWLFVELLA